VAYPMNSDDLALKVENVCRILAILATFYFQSYIISLECLSHQKTA
jgi:hypothetical protein